MKTLSCTLLFMGFTTFLFGQESNIYHKSGKLKIDTSYWINQNRINDFLEIEKYILPDIYNKLEYPNFLAEVSVEGIVITKVIIEKNNKVNVEIVKSSNNYFDKSVISAIDTANLLYRIKELTDIDKPIIFYLPFKFILLDDTFQKDLKVYNSIVIKASVGTPYFEKGAFIRKKE